MEDIYTNQHWRWHPLLQVHCWGWSTMWCTLSGDLISDHHIVSQVVGMSYPLSYSFRTYLFSYIMLNCLGLTSVSCYEGWIVLTLAATIFLSTYLNTRCLASLGFRESCTILSSPLACLFQLTQPLHLDIGDSGTHVRRLISSCELLMVCTIGAIMYHQHGGSSGYGWLEGYWFTWVSVFSDMEDLAYGLASGLYQQRANRQGEEM